MHWNKKCLKDAKLYLILDAQVSSHQNLLKALKGAVRFGVDIVQLRDKNADTKKILAFCKHALKITQHRVPFIVNDRVDLALIAGADGVHLGQEDIPYLQARKLMGANAIIGVSCQNLAHAKQACAQGADYIGFGSVFKTLTKPERNPMNLKLLARVLAQTKIPVFPIGGISRANIGQLTTIGAYRAAVCRDILLANDAGKVVYELKAKLRG